MPSLQAEGVWNKLTELAEKDPQAYEDFIKDQVAGQGLPAGYAEEASISLVVLLLPPPPVACRPRGRVLFLCVSPSLILYLAFS